MIRFFVPGIPQPGGSKRAFLNRKTGRIVVTEDNARSKDWRTSVVFAASAAAAKPLSGALCARFEFVVVRPRSHFGKRGLKPSAPAYPAVRPDTTKLVRATEDALKGIVWLDDSQIVEQFATKRYGETAGAWIMVEQKT